MAKSPAALLFFGKWKRKWQNKRISQQRLVKNLPNSSNFLHRWRLFPVWHRVNVLHFDSQTSDWKMSFLFCFFWKNSNKVVTFSRLFFVESLFHSVRNGRRLPLIKWLLIIVCYCLSGIKASIDETPFGYIKEVNAVSSESGHCCSDSIFLNFFSKYLQV